MKLSINTEQVTKMREEAAAEAEVAATESVKAKKDLEVHHGKLGGIATFNMHLMPEKMLRLYEQQILWMKEYSLVNEVFAIVFKEGTAHKSDSDELVIGCYLPATNTVAIYCGSIMQHAIKTIKDGGDTSLTTNLWLQMLLTLGHELAHSMDDEFQPDEESANQIADDSLTAIAKKFDTNFPAPDQLGVFSDPLRTYIDGLRKVDDAENQKQVQMYDQQLIWTDDMGNVIKDMQEFLKLVAAEDGDSTDASWCSQVQEAPPIAANHQTTIIQPITSAVPAVTTLSPVTDVTPDNTGFATESVEYPLFEPNPIADPATTFQQPVTTAVEYPVYEITDDMFKESVRIILMRTYIHIFSKCGFAGTSFTNPAGVLEPINLTDIPNADKIIIALDTVNSQGQVIKKAPFMTPLPGETRPAGTIKGILYKNGALPAYSLYINPGDGSCMEVKLIPMNPNKCKPNTQELSAWALRAQAGHSIGLIMVNGEMTKRIETAPGQDLTKAYYGPAFN